MSSVSEEVNESLRTSTVLSLFSLSLSEMEDPSLNGVHLSDGEDCILFTQSDLPNNAFSSISEIRNNGQLCDVKVRVKDYVIPAHRVVLAATIPYFHAMFTSSMAESRSEEIEIRDVVNPSTLETLINFAYSGKISISSSNVQNLMTGSSFLQLTRVRDACAEFLMTHLTPHNVLGVSAFADSLGISSLVIACEKYTHKFFSTVADSEEWLYLSFCQIHDIVNLDELHVISESVVFHAILRWIKFDVETRRDKLPELLSGVRLPLLTPHFLTDEVASNELIRSSHKCRDLIDEARDYHLMPERRVLLQSFRTKPRRCSDSNGVIYAVGGQTKSGNSVSTVEVYDPVLGRWFDAEAMSMTRSRVGVAVMKNHLYAIGGYNGSARLNTVEVFDASTKQWSKVASMTTRRSAVGSVALNGLMYVCGGFDGISSLDTVERYNPVTNDWSLVSSMNKCRSAAGVVRLTGNIFALGGHNGLSIFESVEKYDVSTNTWTEVKPMLSKRCRLGVATLHGKLYAVGGYDGNSFLRSVEVFDPVSNSWSYVSSMNVTRSRVAVVSNVDRLWAIGGYDGMKNLSTVEMYNPETDKWTFASSMVSHEGGVGVGVIPSECIY